MTSSTSSSFPPPAVRRPSTSSTLPVKHRVVFIDLARALAVLLMLYGHTVSTLLAPEFREGRWFEIWTFQRGLTSTLFLLLSGFAFSVATSRHWTAHTVPTGALVRRLRRFLLFVLLGYALHFPVGRLGDLLTAGEERWRSFLAVDVLQLIGVTFIGIQLLVLATRSRRLFAGAAGGLAVLIVLATPAVWSVDWSERLRPGLAAYLTPAGGSLFPLFPWSAFILAGTALGQIYARWGAAHLGAYAGRVLLVPGMAMVAAVVAGRSLGWSPLGDGPGAFIPSEVLIRTGAAMVILASLAYAGRRIGRLPHVFAAVAQETLLIYFVHLCIVYGSVWNRGLAHMLGATLGPLETALWVLVLLASMAVLAAYWNWCKHARPRAARWAMAAAAGLLLFALR